MQYQDSELLKAHYPTVGQHLVIRPRRKNVERDYRLVAQNNLDVRLEIVKRQKHEAKIVNGKFYPQPTRYGYRITGLPVRTMTLNELREMCSNLMAIVQSERG